MSKTVTVGSGDYRGGTNEAIQRAVDAVAKAGGGVVRIPAGTYRMHDALYLRSGVRVVGEPERHPYPGRCDPAGPGKTLFVGEGADGGDRK